mmetsp:Transcript_3521/g.7781  ORF Transcript_3521/g.7781 Transcript_3521/m.7781 type:complete len:215 (+) Transcript_3521:1038-1682(+)
MLLDHIIRGGERELLGKVGLNTVLLAHSLLRVVQSLVNGQHSRFEIFNIAILLLNVLLPIELIDIQRMSKVHIIIAPQSAEIGNDSSPGLDLVIMKRPAFPLGERKRHLEMHSGEIAGFECCGTFCSVEVVVEAGCACDEEWGGDADEVYVFLEVVFELGFAEEEGFFEEEAVGEDWCVATAHAVLGRKASKGVRAVESAGHGNRFVDAAVADY